MPKDPGPCWNSSEVEQPLQRSLRSPGATATNPPPGPTRTARAPDRRTQDALALAAREGRLTRNVAAGVRLPRVGRADKVFMTHGQVGELAAAAEPYGLIIRVLAYTGLRWGELAALRVRRVDLVKRRQLPSPGLRPSCGVDRARRPHIARAAAHGGKSRGGRGRQSEGGAADARARLDRAAGRAAQDSVRTEGFGPDLDPVRPGRRQHG